jgi:uncharacterized protein (DUF1330 family)
MPAYCYFDILQVNNEENMQEYRQKVLPVVDKFGGRYIVIGGPFENKEGDWKPSFPVMIEFPTLNDANEWYHSDDYRQLKELRLSSVQSNAVFFQGI